MSSVLNPYLGFRDNAREALEFYKSVFSGDVQISTFEEFHASEDPAEAQKVMHGVLKAPNGITFMCSDTPNAMEFHDGGNINMSLSGDNDEELTGYFNKLSEGGTPGVPLEKAPWGDKFGMFTDKFGIKWMVNIAGKAA